MNNESQILCMNKIEDIYNKTLDFCSNNLEDTLIVFDIDQTLVYPVNKAFCSCSLEAHRSFLNELASTLSREKEEAMWNLAVSGPSKIREEKTLECFNNFKKKGGTVITLTAAGPGKLFEHKRFDIFRYNLLKKKGFDFSDACEETDFCFTEFSSFRGNFPTYYNGMISGNGTVGEATKGRILVAFLKKCKKYPKKVVFIDDLKENINSVAVVLEEQKMPYLSIEYGMSMTKLEEKVSLEEFKASWFPIYEKVKNCSNV
ncbi:MAG: DUF2608 domain-containing protein [Holosporales bacterium]|jgi:hypothetical protein|nr:DUF2608 domain-containing protein [Holosporales bacterium]